MIKRLVFMSLLSSHLLAQTSTEVTNTGQIPVTHPSPEATAFTRITDIPISQHTGVPNIGIPLYNLAYKDLSIPLNLSYHASGVKIGDISSMVGLGWTFDGYGTYSRTIIGGHTEDAGTGWPDFDSLKQNFYDPLWMKWAAGDHENSLGSAWDNRPDIHYYNYPGGSGKFFYGLDGNPKTIPHSRKILQVNSGLVVTDEAGFVYEFDEPEIQQTHNTCGQSLATTYSYYLSRITSPSGAVANYIYTDTEKYEYKEITNQVSYQEVTVDACSPMAPSNCTTTYTIERRRLERIVLNNDLQADFEYIDTKDDVKPVGGQTPKLLNGVIISFGDLGNPITRFDLSYTKITGPSSHEFDEPNINAQIADHRSYAINRIFLTSVKEREKEPYKITYHQLSGTSLALPGRFSAAVDHWGFYNGKINNKTLIPAGWYKDKYWSGADRNADEEYAKYGIIDGIQYPTGGFTKFNFELHQLPIGTVEMPGGGLTVTRSIKAQASGDGGFDSRIFTVSSEASAFRVYYTSNAPEESSIFIDIPHDEAFCRMRILPEGEEDIVFGGSSPATGFSTSLPSGTHRLVVETHGSTANGTPVSGELKLEWQEPATTEEENTGLRPNFDVGGGLRVKSISYFAGPGDGMSQNRSTIYNYTDSDGNSTGQLLYRPRYSFEKYVPDQNMSGGHCLMYGRKHESISPTGTKSTTNVVYGEVTEYYAETLEGPILSSGPQINLLTNLIIFDNDGYIPKNGKKVYEFENALDIVSYNPGSINFIVTDYSWLRGLLKKETAYKSVGSNNFEMVSERTLDYFWNHSPLPFYKPASHPNEYFHYAMQAEIVKPSYIMETGNGPFQVEGTYSGQVYKMVSAWPVLKEEKLIQDGVTYLTNYEYDEDHLQLKKKVTTTSRGSVTEESYYPEDFEPGTTSFLSYFQDNHILNPVIKQSSFIDQGEGNHLLSSSITEYVDGTTLPESISIWQPEAPVPIDNLPVHAQNNSRFTTLYPSFNSGLWYRQEQRSIYDAANNPIEVKRTFDSPTAYVWHPNTFLPIAKVSNAEHSNVYYTSFEETNENCSAKTGAKCKSISGSFGFAGNFDPGEYTLTYWWKPSSTADWIPQRKEINYTGPGSIILEQTSGFIDEVRFIPKNAFIESYSFNNHRKVISTTDANGLTTYYKYDDQHRLIKVLDDDMNLVRQINYTEYKDN